MEKEELIALGIEEDTADKIVGEQEKLIAQYESRIALVQKEHEVEKILINSGARNLKAVRALLGDGDVEEIRELVDKLKNDEETRFLFEKKGSFMPARSPESLPGVKKPGFEERLAEARRKGDTIEAIRIKQQAAEEGIMLL